MKTTASTLFFLSFAAAANAQMLPAQVSIASVFSDHAVLQRERPIHLWGTAAPGMHLQARLHAQTVAVEANELGKWSVYLMPEKAGGPYDLTVTGEASSTILHDILIGDVWFASGQSNMEMPLSGFPPTASVKDGAQEIAAADHPQIRLLLVDHKSSDFPLNSIGGQWKVCTPDSAKQFSAVGYFFGREISEREKVPVGLIDASWGGTPADSWVSLDTLGSDASLLPALASRATFADEQADLDARIAMEKREDAADTAAGRPVSPHPWHPYEMSWLPAGIYNGMVAPVTQMTVKGFIWYQGETNSARDRAPEYGRLFAALIGDWRSHFQQGNLPFLFVQISSFDSPGENWGLVREQQRRTLGVANTAMAVTLDVGAEHNVHPPDKQTVGARLALAARNVVYGEPVMYEGPAFREATTEMLADRSETMRVWFDHAEGLTTRGGPLDSFELAGFDHHFFPAEATIEAQTVVVRAATVPHPHYVRFGWRGVVTANVYNRAGMPASTFTSEQNPVH